MPEGRDGFSLLSRIFASSSAALCCSKLSINYLTFTGMPGGGAGMRGWVPAFVFTGAGSRREDNERGKGSFHVGMVAREREFRQWRHVSRWWKKRDGSPPFVFTGAGSRREDKGKGAGISGGRKGVFHVGMVAREGEFRQWRHVSRSGSVVVGYSGQGNETERKDGIILH